MKKWIIKEHIHNTQDYFIQFIILLLVKFLFDGRKLTKDTFVFAIAFQ